MFKSVFSSLYTVSSAKTSDVSYTFYLKKVIRSSQFSSMLHMTSALMNDNATAFTENTCCAKRFLLSQVYGQYHNDLIVYKAI